MRTDILIYEEFDYTKWQESLYSDVTLEELVQKADEFWKGIHQ